MDESVSKPQVSYRTAGDNDEGQRLDNYLARQLKGVPRSLVYRILRRGEVRVNGGRCQPSYKLRAGDEIRLPPVRVSAEPVVIPSSNLHLVQDLRERILFEDDGILVVNKPSGLAAHGGSGIEFGLIEALRALRDDLGYLELAHRLDRDTSGCLIVAKRRSALRHLHEQFRQRQVKKRYLTLVPGSWDRKLQVVSAPLKRNELRSGERMVMVDFNNGAPSSTGFDIVEEYAGATLMAALPHTGRTHQIRVHCAYVHHPVGGDEKYGDKEFNALLRSAGFHGMFLHASRISFINPSDGELLKIEAPMSAQLEQILSYFREGQH
ncbi:MAG: 23S rRNA pseudouridine(955/2504/2580) synthase RluC [Succinivibrio sp.]|nr:23S rRNA pseudouridine(955/2504/2580) synthase RluC [Succinivibrio sp.]